MTCIKNFINIDFNDLQTQINTYEEKKGRLVVLVMHNMTLCILQELNNAQKTNYIKMSETMTEDGAIEVTAFGKRCIPDDNVPIGTIELLLC